MNKLSAQAQIITKPVRDTERFILASAYEVTPDEQGRVVLPEILTTYASLKGEVSFLGLGDRVEIWDREHWIQREKFVSENAAIFIEKIASGRVNNDKNKR